MKVYHENYVTTVFSKKEHETFYSCLNNLLDERRVNELPYKLSKHYSKRIKITKKPKDLVLIVKELAKQEYHPSTFVANRLLWHLIRNNWGFNFGLTIYRYLMKWKLNDASSKNIMTSEIFIPINNKSPKFFWEMADFSRYMSTCAPNIPFLFYGGVNRDILLKNKDCNDFDIFWGGTHEQLKNIFPEARQLPFENLQHVYVAKFNFRELNISVIECDKKKFKEKCDEYLNTLLPLSIDSMTSRVMIDGIYGHNNLFISISDTFNARANIADSVITLPQNIKTVCEKNPIVLFRALAYELKGFKLGNELSEFLSGSKMKTQKNKLNYLAIQKVYANKQGRVLSYLYRLLKIAPGDKVMQLLDLRGLLPLIFKDAVCDLPIYKSKKERFYELFADIGAKELVFYEQVCVALLKDRILVNMKKNDIRISIFEGIEYLHQQIGSKIANDNTLLYLLLLDEVDTYQGHDELIKSTNTPYVIEKFSIMPEDFNKGLKRFCQIKGAKRAIELFSKYIEWQGLFDHQLVKEMSQTEYLRRLLSISKTLDSSKFIFSSDFYAIILLVLGENNLTILSFDHIINLYNTIEKSFIKFSHLELIEGDNKSFINKSELLFSLLNFMTEGRAKESKIDYPFKPGESFWEWLGGDRKQFSYSLKKLFANNKKPETLILSDFLFFLFPKQIQAIRKNEDSLELYISLFNSVSNRMHIEEFYACLIVASNIEKSTANKHDDVWLLTKEFVNTYSDNASSDFICDKFLLFFEIENILIKLNLRLENSISDCFVELNDINSFKQTLISNGRKFGDGLMKLFKRNKAYISEFIKIIELQGIWGVFIPKLQSTINADTDKRRSLIANIARCEYKCVEQFYAALINTLVDKGQGIDKCISDFISTWVNIEPASGVLPHNKFYCDEKRLKSYVLFANKQQTQDISKLADAKLSLKT